VKPFISLMLDCIDPKAQAAFWTQALGYTVVEDGEPMVLGPGPDGVDGPVLLMQTVSDRKAAKNRMHMDVHTPDLEAEVTRMIGLGATRLEDQRESRGWCWVVMADPEGNEFCVCTPPAG